MDAIIFLAPLSLLLGGMGLLAFFWTFKSGQYEDPKGAAVRILDDHLDQGPSQEPAQPPAEIAQRPRH